MESIRPYTHNIYLILLFFLGLSYPQTIQAQEDDCERIRVAVYARYQFESTFNYLKQKSDIRSKEEWIDYMDFKVVEALRANSPEIDFFLARKNKGKDPHYLFKYWLNLHSIDTKVIVPTDSTTYIDPMSGYEVTEYTDPIYDRETGFQAGAILSVNSPCVPNLNYGLHTDITAGDLELENAIIKLSRKFWRIINLIEESERRRPVPARGPELEISYEKDYLSLLTKEERQMEVIGKVMNCKGEYLYREVRSQPVYFPKEVNRCKYEQVRGFLQAGTYKGNDIVLTQSTYEARGRYIVQNGIKASVERVPLGSCGIGASSEIYKEGELIIRGLEVKVKPNRREIAVNESTKIVISLNETDPDGNKYPVAGREIKVNISGVVNGRITPKGPYTTNENSEVTLTYKAGDKDSRIEITGSFQPPEYPDKAVDHSNIRVNPTEYDATLTLRKKVIKTAVSHFEQSYQQAPCQIEEKDDLEFNETIDASVRINLKSVGSIDMFMLNQRWETYEVVDVTLTNFTLDSKKKVFSYHKSTGSKCAEGFFEQTDTTEKILTDRDVGQGGIGGTWVVAFDKDTDQAVLIFDNGVSVGYEYNEVHDMHLRTNVSEKSQSDTKQKSDGFNLEAVEDEKPFPEARTRSPQMEKYIDSITGEEEELDIFPLVPEPKNKGMAQQKIHPDLIVEFGDGKTYFGGVGRKVIPKEIPHGSEQEEQIFIWRMTRKESAQ